MDHLGLPIWSGNSGAGHPGHAGHAGQLWGEHDGLALGLTSRHRQQLPGAGDGVLWLLARDGFAGPALLGPHHVRLARLLGHSGQNNLLALRPGPWHRELRGLQDQLALLVGVGVLWEGGVLPTGGKIWLKHLELWLPHGLLHRHLWLARHGAGLASLRGGSLHGLHGRTTVHGLPMWGCRRKCWELCLGHCHADLDLGIRSHRVLCHTAHLLVLRHGHPLLARMFLISHAVF